MLDYDILSSFRPMTFKNVKFSEKVQLSAEVHVANRMRTTANLNMLSRCSYECFMRHYNLFSCNFHVQASKQHIFSIYDSFMTCFVCSLPFYSFILHVFVVGAKFNHIGNRFFSTYFFWFKGRTVWS